MASELGHKEHGARQLRTDHLRADEGRELVILLGYRPYVGYDIISYSCGKHCNILYHTILNIILVILDYITIYRQ